ncbi:YIP1 family protein [Staphylococcus americanisciuri]|uniref:YIP1 family protein n=1 Tax=Staphylococcus americanisciuri TaxID=2973940 RepID=A0ABT2F3Y7_9STAP|nr:YIP1 family protein [Staphylococcus americanisciuri]MCS4487102.1 YIP1 family protein [Staphylococcus americanisciuri]
MDYSKLLHIDIFAKQRFEPKVGLKMLVFLLLVVATITITSFTTDFSALISENSTVQGADAEQIATFTKYGAMIGGFVGALISVGFIFLVLFIIDKIFKSETRPKSVFSAVLLRAIVVYAIQLVALIIQWIVGLDSTQVNITSLNAFNPDNEILGVINLVTLVSAWLFGVTLHSTMQIDKRWSWIFTAIYLVLFIGLPLIFALI